MKCAYCTKRLMPCQSTEPLGCGYLIDTFGQREHTECSDKRRKMIEEGYAETAVLLAKLRVQAQERGEQV